MNGMNDLTGEDVLVFSNIHSFSGSYLRGTLHELLISEHIYKYKSHISDCEQLHRLLS